MELRSIERRDTDGVSKAATRAQKIIASDTILPGVSMRMLIGGAALVVVGLLAYGARIYGVPVSGVLNQTISTENALTMYTTFAGIGGFLANIIASSLISTVEGDTVQIGAIILPVAVQITGAVIAAATFPSGDSTGLPV